MKRDMKLVKRILKYVEGKAQNDGKTLDVPDIPDYEAKEVDYHLKLCKQAGFLEVRETADAIYPVALTWAGHDKLDDLRGGGDA